MTDHEKEIKELTDELYEAQQEISILKDEIRNLENELDEHDDHECENPFYEIDDETLEDSVKSELLKEHWEYFTAQQLEGFLKMIGRSI